MKKLLFICILFCTLAISAGAVELETAPIPETGTEYLPDTQGNFAQDLWYVIKTALYQIRPDLAEGLRLCVSLFAATVLLSVVSSFTTTNKRATELCGVVLISTLLLQSANTMIHLGAETVQQISHYGNLLLPVMTAALAAQGAVTTSAALYAGTALFDAVLSTAISSVLIPMVYVYIALSVANAATGEAMLKKLRDFVKWLITWCLKLILYIFIGYMSITGVVSGATDQVSLKAMKLTISGAVPVVGNILSDASEAVLVSVSVMKNSAGVFGILACIAILIGPFLKIGVQYALLKLTGFLSGVIGSKSCQELIDCFSTAMGLLLAMTGTVCLMQLICVICFMRGVGI